MTDDVFEHVAFITEPISSPQRATRLRRTNKEWGCVLNCGDGICSNLRELATTMVTMLSSHMQQITCAIHALKTYSYITEHNYKSPLTAPLLWKKGTEFNGSKDMFNVVREVSSFINKLAEVAIKWQWLVAVGFCLEGSTDCSCEFANTFALRRC